MGDGGGRSELEAPRHGLHRHLLPPQGGSRHAARGDGARDRRSPAPGQDPLFRRLQSSRLAHRRDLQHRRPLRHRPPGGEPALLQRDEPHARGRAASGLRAGRQDMRMMQTERRPESLHRAQQIKAHAEARRITPGQFAVAWVLNNRLVTAVIGGPRTEEQWDDYLGALAYRFTAEDEALIDRLVPTGHPSTPGYNDPAYPIEGRVPRNAS